MIRRKSFGFLNSIIASVSYGTNPLFALPLYAVGIGVNSVLFYRYFFAVIIYGIWLKTKKKISLKLSRAEFFIIAGLAILFSLSSWTLFEAFRYIASGLACTILFIYPIMVAVIGAIFFKEKITKNTIIAIVLTLLGINFLYNNNGVKLDIVGIIWVLLSALTYALYMVGVKYIKKIQHVKVDVLNFYTMFIGLFVYVFNLKFCTELQILNSPKLWFCALGLALFPTIISLETTTIAIKLIGSTKTAIIGALEPITAVIIGVTVFQEQLTPITLFGIFLILFGVTFVIKDR